MACQNQLNSLSSTSTATGQFCPFCCIGPFNLFPWSPWLSFCTYINQIQLNINVWCSLACKPHQIPHTNQIIWLFAHYCLLFCTITILCTRNLLKLVTIKFMQKLNFTGGALALGGTSNVKQLASITKLVRNLPLCGLNTSTYTQSWWKSYATGLLCWMDLLPGAGFISHVHSCFISVHSHFSYQT